MEKNNNQHVAVLQSLGPEVAFDLEVLRERDAYEFYTQKNDSGDTPQESLVKMALMLGHTSAITIATTTWGGGAREKEEEEEDRRCRWQRDYSEKIAKSVTSEVREVFDQSLAIRIMEAHDQVLAQMRLEVERKAHEEIQRVAAEHTARMVEVKSSAALEIARLTARCEGLQSHVDHATPYLREIEQLKNELDTKQRTLDLLQSTNFARGLVGESTVARAFADSFPSAHVVDSSKIKHSCDLLATFPDGKVIAIEVKNKQTITPADLQKFAADVRYLRTQQQGFVAALFVSLGTRNIPGKGDLHFDVVERDVPIAYLGVDGGDLLNTLLGRVIKILMDTREIVASYSEQAVAISDVVEKVRGLFDRVRKLRQHNDRVRAMGGQLIDLADASRKDIEALFDGFTDILGKVPRSSRTTQHEAASASGASACPECGRSFATRSGLKKHMQNVHNHHTTKTPETPTNPEACGLPQ